MLDPLKKNSFEAQKNLDPPIKFFLFMAMVILSTLVERFSVSRIRDFFFKCKKLFKLKATISFGLQRSGELWPWVFCHLGKKWVFIPFLPILHHFSRNQINLKKFVINFPSNFFFLYIFLFYKFYYLKIYKKSKKKQ